MCRGRWRVLALVALVGLVAGCGGGGGGATTAPSPTTEATTASPTAVAPPEGLEATVVDVINEVEAHALPDEDFAEALADMVIYLGGRVWAKEASTARLEMMEDGLIRVAPNTIFTLGQPELDALELELDEGQVWIDIEGLAPGETFQVETQAAVASVRGTRFGVRAGEDGTTIVSTRVDTVTVSAASQVVTVTAGFQTTVTPGDPPSAPEPMSRDEQVRWGMAGGSELDMVLPVVGPSSVITATGYSFQNTDWSPEGDSFVFSYYDPELEGYTNMFYDATDGTPAQSPLPANANGVFFNPAGDGLAYQSWDSSYLNSSICTAERDGSNSSCFGGDAIYGWPFWSPDGEWIAFYSNRTALASGALLSLPGPGGEAFGPMAHPVGVGVEQSSSETFNLFRVRPDGSDMSQLTQDNVGNNIRQSWSPEGDLIAFVYAPEYNGPGDAWVMNADGSEPRMLFEGVYGNGYDHLAWSPDGSSLVVPADGGGLHVVPVDGSDPQLVPGTEGWICWNPVWSPNEDGWPLFFHGGDPAGDLVGLWYVLQMEEEPEYFGPVDWGPFPSPDGGQLAVGFFDQEEGEPAVAEVYYFGSNPEFWR